jgi:hypothetical protein
MPMPPRNFPLAKFERASRGEYKNIYPTQDRPLSFEVYMLGRNKLSLSATMAVELELWDHRT